MLYKTKALISSARQDCTFVFAVTCKNRFSRDAHLNVAIFHSKISFAVKLLEHLLLKHPINRRTNQECTCKFSHIMRKPVLKVSY